MKIEYNLNTASEFELVRHLEHCNNDFVPTLSTRVSIEAYSKKLCENALIFEAWECDILVGMVAMYINKNQNGFVSNVSVYSEYGGKGIASQLFSNLLTYSSENGISNIKLEVFASNIPAISLYKKFGFKSIDKRNNQVIMLKKLTKNENRKKLQPRI